MPSEWKGKYYPSYIPESFGLSRIDSFYNIVYYTSKDDQVLEYSEFVDADYSNIDIDQEDAFGITVNESLGLAMSNGEGTTITWCIDDTYLYLRFSGDLDEAKRIAESVRLINKN